MLLSAVFIVPSRNTFGGMRKGSLLCGSVTASPRLSASRSVISSPKTLATLARWISSTSTRKDLDG
jgi:hypothetical protein